MKTPVRSRSYRMTRNATGNSVDVQINVHAHLLPFRADNDLIAVMAKADVTLTVLGWTDELSDSVLDNPSLNPSDTR